MAGTIIGAQGFQRSGKTLLMYLMAKSFKEDYGLPVYSNIMSEKDGFIFINSIDELPFNFEPKVLFIDEIYNGADAQNWKSEKMKQATILINTLGKQNVLLLFTTIDFGMVYNRIRNQMQYAILVKADSKNIYYQVINCNNMQVKEMTLAKTDKLFSTLNYDTNYVPIDFNWDMTSFKSKLIEYYKDEYPMLIKYVR